MAGAETIDIICQSDEVERLLGPMRDLLGADYEGYRGHIYRVLTYALHFLGNDESHRLAIETALVYHDIGMWTDGTLAYLEPSIARALTSIETNGSGLDQELIRHIIFWHHKFFAFRGPDARVVNAVRRADWIDATRGLVKMGLDKKLIAAVNAAIPDAGFYATLQRMATNLGGGSQMKGLGKVLLNVYKF